MDCKTSRKKDKKNGTMAKMVRELGDLLPSSMSERFLVLNSLDSKLETIESAIRYIKHLQEHTPESVSLLSTTPSASSGASSPQSESKVETGDHKGCCQFMKLTKEARDREFKTGYQACIKKTVELIRQINISHPDQVTISHPDQVNMSSMLAETTTAVESSVKKTSTPLSFEDFTMQLVNSLLGFLDTSMVEKPEKEKKKETKSSSTQTNEMERLWRKESPRSSPEVIAIESPSRIRVTEQPRDNNNNNRKGMTLMQAIPEKKSTSGRLLEELLREQKKTDYSCSSLHTESCPSSRETSSRMPSLIMMREPPTTSSTQVVVLSPKSSSKTFSPSSSNSGSSSPSSEKKINLSTTTGSTTVQKDVTKERINGQVCKRSHTDSLASPQVIHPILNQPVLRQTVLRQTALEETSRTPKTSLENKNSMPSVQAKECLSSSLSEKDICSPRSSPPSSSSFFSVKKQFLHRFDSDKCRENLSGPETAKRMRTSSDPPAVVTHKCDQGNVRAKVPQIVPRQSQLEGNRNKSPSTPVEVIQQRITPSDMANRLRHYSRIGDPSAQFVPAKPSRSPCVAEDMQNRVRHYSNIGTPSVPYDPATAKPTRSSCVAEDMQNRMRHYSSIRTPSVAYGHPTPKSTRSPCLGEDMPNRISHYSNIGTPSIAYGHATPKSSRSPCISEEILASLSMQVEQQHQYCHTLCIPGHLYERGQVMMPNRSNSRPRAANEVQDPQPRFSSWE